MASRPAYISTFGGRPAGRNHCSAGVRVLVSASSSSLLQTHIHTHTHAFTHTICRVGLRHHSRLSPPSPLQNSPRLKSVIEGFQQGKQSFATGSGSQDTVVDQDPLVKFKTKEGEMASSSSSSTNGDTFSVAFESNSKWRRNLAELHPDLFEKLGKGQSPEILWIGCADSRCPETTILGLQPGDIFCHRNIANILVATDLNSLSVIQYAVQYLKVKHIIVCGHTSCGGIAAALDNKALGLIDTWLMPLRNLRAANAKVLQGLSEKERGLKMVDLNVRRSVSVLLENPVVIDAMVERGLAVHGVIYDVGSGELNELDISEDDAVVEERKKAFKVATAV